MPGLPSVTLVLPTVDRLPALEATLPDTLAVRGVDEVVVVDDGSTDATVAWLREATAHDARVRIVRQERRSFLPATRNRGIEEAHGDWVVFGEDDCHLPADYVEVLLAEAERTGADVIGAPWVFTAGRPLEEALAEARAGAVEDVAFDQVQRFPARPMQTPFIPALVMISRRVIDAGLRYDPGYGGNAYREETDFFVGATRMGFRCVLTPATCSWQDRRWTGGASMASWRYELWTVRNDARFRRKHGRWMQEQGLMGPPGRTGLLFAWRRLRPWTELQLRIRLGRVRRALAR